MQIIRPRPTELWLGTLFIAYHLAATLISNAPRGLRDPLWPLFQTYAEGLRMTGSFGVFARYTAHSSVAVYGVSKSGQRRLLSHTSPVEPSAADARVIKIQRKFVHEEARDRLGQAYLAHFCRDPQNLRVELALEREDGVADSKTVLARDCRGAHD